MPLNQSDPAQSACVWDVTEDPARTAPLPCQKQGFGLQSEPMRVFWPFMGVIGPQDFIQLVP